MSKTAKLGLLAVAVASLALIAGALFLVLGGGAANKRPLDRVVPAVPGVGSGGPAEEGGARDDEAADDSSDESDNEAGENERGENERGD